MPNITTNMLLRQWNLGTDYFNYTELYQNFSLIDNHDHSSGKGIQVPTAGLANLSVTQAKIAPAAVGTSQLQDGALVPSKLAGAPTMVAGQSPIWSGSAFFGASPGGGILQGLLSARPAAAIQGRLYYATDTGDFFLDTGSTWIFSYSTALVEYAAGNSFATTSPLPPGSPVASVPGVFGRGVYQSVANAGATISLPGLYRVSYIAKKTGSNSPWTVYANVVAGIIFGESIASSSATTFAGTSTVRLGASSTLGITQNSVSGDSSQLLSLIIARVSP